MPCGCGGKRRSGVALPVRQTSMVYPPMGSRHTLPFINGFSIGSAILAQLTIMTIRRTHRETDRTTMVTMATSYATHSNAALKTTDCLHQN